MKVALYDFCETIANFQTGDEYVFFTQEYLDLKRFSHTYMNNRLIYRLLEKDWRRKKSAILYQLKGLSREELEKSAREYYNRRVRPNIYRAIVDQIIYQKKDGYMIYLVSAGYTVYLQFFAEEFGLNGVISNDFKYANDMFTGKIQRNDCIGDEKKTRLEEFFYDKQIEHSVSYSDSISDLPMLRWSDDGVVVSREKARKWVSENGLKDFVLAEHGLGLLGQDNS